MSCVDDLVNSIYNKGTKYNYKKFLKDYMQRLEITDPDAYIKEDRNFAKDIITWIQKTNYKAPQSLKVGFHILKRFFIFNDIELSQKDLMLIKNAIPKGDTLTMDEVLSPEQLKRVLMDANIKDRAFYLSLATSGMRLDELLSVKLSEVNVDTDPITIKVRALTTKKKYSRITFVSKEASGFIREWLKHRQKYLNTALAKTKNLNRVVDVNSEYLFPFSDSTARKCWYRLLKKAGLDQQDSTTNYYIYHIHTLRMYFKTQMARASKMELANLFVGHRDLNTIYVRLPIDELRQQYIECEPYLSVFESPVDLSHLQDKIKDMESRIEDGDTYVSELDAVNQRLIEQNKELKSRLDKLNGKVKKDTKTDLEARLRKLEKLLEDRL